ncbi:MAG: hypothetical protein Q9188_002553 [Gyalolechia gomerana]
MPTARIRGGTPVDYPGEQHMVNDPELTALLDKLDRRMRQQREEYLQAAVDEANAAYQPPPYVEISDGEDSPPFGGLPSPAASPRHAYSQLPGAHPRPSAVSDPPSLQPVDSDMAEVDGEAHSTSDLQSNPSIARQPQLPVLQAGRKGNSINPSSVSPSLVDDKSSEHWSAAPTTNVSRLGQRLLSQRQFGSSARRKRQTPPCSATITRSKASPQTTFWELEESGRRGLPLSAKRLDISSQVSLTSSNPRQRLNNTTSFAGIRKQQARRRRT